MEPYLVAGLGNPGPQYAANRHNVGFRCLERLATLHELVFDRRQKRSLVALGTIRGQRVILAKPQAFMNESGRAVVPLARFYKVEPERLLVVYDDLDLPLGTLRIRPEGGSGGHKGMRSLIQHLGTTEFPRIRLGIDRPPGRMPAEAYVLQKFKPDEWEAMLVTYERAAEAVEAVLARGIDRAMSQFNIKP